MALGSSGLLLLLLGGFGAAHHPNLFEECSKLFNPKNYIEQLPSLSLPYVDSVPIPTVPLIKPTPVVTTKVINVVTKYVNKNPVCIRVSRKKPPCKVKKGAVKKGPQEYLVTKEYVVRDRQVKSEYLPQFLSKPHKTLADYVAQDVPQEESQLYIDGGDADEEDGHHYYLETSEKPRAFTRSSKTPTLSPSQLQNLLIEDRLDHLEKILPHYTRQRIYQTTTITVTKVVTDDKPTATLLVKNCVPLGIERCPPRKKKRKSKVTQYTDVSFRGK